jgi:hypothetical protein
MSVYQWKKDEEKYLNVHDADNVVEFGGFGDNTSFKAEFDFMYGHTSGPHVDMMVGYDSGWRMYKGWNIGFEDSVLSFKIGNGGGWDVVRSGGQFPNHHWCHAICVLDEKELTSIYEQLSRLIVENSDIMNKNKMVKDALTDLQAQDLGSKVSNIKALINTNVNLLQEHQRWGDTGDKYWKFNA